MSRLHEQLLLTHWFPRQMPHRVRHLLLMTQNEVENYAFTRIRRLLPRRVLDNGPQRPTDDGQGHSPATLILVCAQTRAQADSASSRILIHPPLSFEFSFIFFSFPPPTRHQDRAALASSINRVIGQQNFQVQALVPSIMRHLLSVPAAEPTSTKRSLLVHQPRILSDSAPQTANYKRALAIFNGLPQQLPLTRLSPFTIPSSQDVHPYWTQPAAPYRARSIVRSEPSEPATSVRQTLSFMDLPMEMRAIVYACVFEEEKTIYPAPPRHIPNRFQGDLVQGHMPSLFLVNKSVSLECRKHFAHQGFDKNLCLRLRLEDGWIYDAAEQINNGDTLEDLARIENHLSREIRHLAGWLLRARRFELIGTIVSFRTCVLQGRWLIRS